VNQNPTINETKLQTGIITRISGPVVGVSGLENIRLYDVVQVGELGLIGEVIHLSSNLTTVQVYENTDGVRVGEPVTNTGVPLVVGLGPGLLGSVYDGLQRPLAALAQKAGYYIQRGLNVLPLDENVRWSFTPRVAVGDIVRPGDCLGVIPESKTIEHRVLVPPDHGGRVTHIKPGRFQLNDGIARIEPERKSDLGGSSRSPQTDASIVLTLCQHWPVRQPRPVSARLPPREPMITGTRIIDVLFPVAKGGTAIIPGGFGTGKTVAEQSLARWSDIDIVVYVGCGERGNEMTAVLEEFPHLEDPRTGMPLMERTILIANTSNMPVAAREASIYTGITIAEYYRDMGYAVLLLADSTSRWGEALREISGRLQEMPGEEGYPAYLAARLAEFYERSGRVVCLGHDANAAQAPSERIGSVTVVGAVSPPGGDFSEPITQNSMRVAGTFWALDYDLSRRRHFPAINWTNSYSLYDLADWNAGKVASDWSTLTAEARALLQREVELLEIVRLVGPDALDEVQRAVLAIARMLREDFLQQSALDPVDRYCTITKAYWMLKAIMDYYQRTQQALATGVSLAKILGETSLVVEISRMKEYPLDQAATLVQKLMERVRICFEEFRQSASEGQIAPSTGRSTRSVAEVRNRE
jgi:V/A-type H+/Na+-transporting ATPase subunit A